MDIWQKINIEENKLLSARIGNISLFIKKVQNDWYISQERKSTEKYNITVKKDNTADQLHWERYIVITRSNIINFMPLLPDKPLVVRPSVPLRLLPASRITVFINIPVWINIVIGEENSQELVQIPSVILSNTWFGDTVTGELCYSKRSYAMGDLENLNTSMHQAVCPLNISNESQTILDFERICLHVELLSIFLGTDRLWTNKVNITFRGKEKISQINISKKPPDSIKILKQLCLPREKYNSGILKRSFQFLKNIAGF